MAQFNEHDMDGISVRRERDTWRIIHNDECIGIISLMPNGRPGWDWHTAFMWRFRAADMVNV